MAYILGIDAPLYRGEGVPPLSLFGMWGSGRGVYVGMLGSDEMKVAPRKRGRPAKGASEPRTIVVKPKADIVEGSEERDYTVKESEPIHTEEEIDILALYKSSYDRDIIEFFMDREKWCSGQGGFPCLEKWCVKLTPPMRVKDIMLWASEKPNFKKSLEIANDCIKSLLLDMGMDKRFSSEFLKWGLGTIHDMAPVEKRKAVKEEADSNLNVTVSVVD